MFFPTPVGGASTEWVNTFDPLIQCQSDVNIARTQLSSLNFVIRLERDIISFLGKRILYN